MRLSQKDRDILLCAQLQANASVPEISKQTGYREHTVRYSIQRMREEQVMAPYPFINLYSLGYQLFEIFFSAAFDDKHTEADLIKAFVDAPEIVWLMEMGGDFQYGTAVIAQHIQEVSDTLDRLSEHLGGVFFEKSVAVRVSWRVFGRKYLSERTFHKTPVRGELAGQIVVLDDLDKKILSSLSNEPEMGKRERADKVEIPLSTLEYRIKRLEDRGVIRGYLYSIDATRFGMSEYRLLVYAKGMNPSFTEELFSYCSSQPHIVAAAHCIGTWDYELACEVENTQKISEIRRVLYEQFPNKISTVKVLPVFKERKISLYPFTIQ